MDEENKVSAIQSALNLIVACHNKELLFTVAHKIAEAFTGNDEALEYLSDKTVERLHEIESSEPNKQPVHRLRVADA